MKKTRVVKVADVTIGGGNPVVIQSMIKTPLQGVKEILNTILKLKREGCEIIRIAYKEKKDSKFLKTILKESRLPVEVDTHFTPSFAVDAVKLGADAVRINPGNTRKEQLKDLVEIVRERSVPVRIGANSGSIPDKYRVKYNVVDGMVRLIEEYISFFERYDFKDIMLSAKSNSVQDTYYANLKLSALFDYPLHIGVTATGMGTASVIKSSIGIGSLLLQGIGDTLRVSYTGAPVKEIKMAKDILSAVGLRKFGPELISCPGCSRSGINILKLAGECEKEIKKMHIKEPLKIAVMGCEVNGPGEAKDSDIGIAGGKKSAILFKKGKIIKKMPQEKIVPVLIAELKNMIEEK